MMTMTTADRVDDGHLIQRTNDGTHLHRIWVRSAK
jgi:hypothetical protein